MTGFKSFKELLKDVETEKIEPSTPVPPVTPEEVRPFPVTAEETKLIGKQPMTVEERKLALSLLGRSTNFHRQFHAGDALQAIDLLNKMDNVYKQEVKVEHEVVHTFTFMLPDGSSLTPGKPLLKEGKNESVRQVQEGK